MTVEVVDRNMHLRDSRLGFSQHLACPQGGDPHKVLDVAMSVFVTSLAPTQDYS